VFGIASTAALLFSFLRRRKPSHVVVRETRFIEPVRVRSSIRERVRITFDGEEIERLGQLNAEVYNKGSEPIAHPTITVEFPSETTVLDASLADDDAAATVSIDQNRVRITCDYLNPVSDHQQRLHLSAIVSGDPGNIRVYGGGEGWSVRRLPLPTPRAVLRHLFVFTALGVVLVASSYVYGRWLEKHYGISLSEVSLRAFLAYLPFWLLLASWLVWSIMSLRRLRHAGTFGASDAA
jgi:hypothetical protein